MDKTNYSFYFLIIVLIFYFWYYLTLPGSFLSFTKNKKIKKPTLYEALMSFIMYKIPFLIIMYYINNYMNSEDAAKILCNMCKIV